MTKLITVFKFFDCAKNGDSMSFNVIEGSQVQHRLKFDCSYRIHFPFLKDVSAFC
jgi:hypothetical protein